MRDSATPGKPTKPAKPSRGPSGTPRSSPARRRASARRWRAASRASGCDLVLVARRAGELDDAGRDAGAPTHGVACRRRSPATWRSPGPRAELAAALRRRAAADRPAGQQRRRAGAAAPSSSMTPQRHQRAAST
ncbi:MAG: hypothetical protein MZW92_57760 [Comamonadaceae bacterium]|nr:hypothetical protein [Comamonadaceae bacterium]